MISQSVTNRTLNLDKNVWKVMFITGLLCASLLCYSYVSRERCTSYNIITRGIQVDDKYQLGEPLFFSSTLSNGAEIYWDFGDKTDVVVKNSYSMVKHTYTKEGIYTVSARTKMVCSNVEVRVRIAKATTSTPSTKFPKIKGNISPKVGQPVSYISDIFDGTDYEWKILDRSDFPTINKQEARYAFQKPGLYKLQLTVDHDKNNKRSLLEINVTEGAPRPSPRFIPPPMMPKGKKPKPETYTPLETPPATVEKPTNKVEEPKTPESKKNTKIGNRSFEKMLEDVINGEKHLEDFNEFLALGGKTTVRVAEEKLPKKFYQLINQIAGKKRYSISNVELVKDPNDETIIKSINLSLMDNRSFIKKVLGKE